MTNFKALLLMLLYLTIYPINVDLSVVVAKLTVTQQARVRFPRSPQHMTKSKTYYKLCTARWSKLDRSLKNPRLDSFKLMMYKIRLDRRL